MRSSATPRQNQTIHAPPWQAHIRQRALFASLMLCLAGPAVRAQTPEASPIEITTTVIQGPQAATAKLAHLRPQLNQILQWVQQARYAEAGPMLSALRQSYEAGFDNRLAQYSFASNEEHAEFLQKSGPAFEWIDWGYAECLQMLAFVAFEQKDPNAALTLLQTLERIAPTSASAANETGFVLNQLRQPEAAMASYRRAHALSIQYASQQRNLPVALRGIGYTLVELGQLDEAEKVFVESLAIDPDSKVALRELEYIRRRQGRQ